MDNQLHPQEMPRVRGWIMVAPAGTTIPDAVPTGGTFSAPGWSDEWRMADDIPAMVRIENGCRCMDNARPPDGVPFSVRFVGHWPQDLGTPPGIEVVMVVDDSGSGVRLVMPRVTACGRTPQAYHILDGDPPWYVLCAGYYGNPTEVRPYRVRPGRIRVGIGG